MSDFQLMFQLFALLLGLSMAELLAGLARSWRIRVGAGRITEATIRIGWLVPLLGLLLLIDQSRFWLTAYAMRNYVTFDYFSLLAMLTIIGGYYAISTFVFPDQPSHWPDFDDYFVRTNRTVVGGMILVNLAMVAYAIALITKGASLEDAPIARNWISLVAGLIYLAALALLWLSKSKRANLVLLVAANVLLITAALGPRLH